MIHDHTIRESSQRFNLDIVFFDSQAVKRFMNLECKCHGVSGSCNVRTCWLAMADFRQTGDFLRKKYNNAIQVVMNQYGTSFTSAYRMFKKPTKNDLVYFEDSPDYCIWDHESGKCAEGNLFLKRVIHPKCIAV